MKVAGFITSVDLPLDKFYVHSYKTETEPESILEINIKPCLDFGIISQSDLFLISEGTILTSIYPTITFWDDKWTEEELAGAREKAQEMARLIEGGE